VGESSKSIAVDCDHDLELGKPGKWYHVCAVYDGSTMQLWVNGQFDGESSEQKGNILYSKAAKLSIGTLDRCNELKISDEDDRKKRSGVSP
jgi:hypothetical protein